LLTHDLQWLFSVLPVKAGPQRWVPIDCESPGTLKHLRILQVAQTAANLLEIDWGIRVEKSVEQQPFL
jgi:hypothetical protein